MTAAKDQVTAAVTGAILVEIRGEDISQPRTVLKTFDDGGLLSRFWSFLKDNDIRWLARAGGDYTVGRWSAFFEKGDARKIRAWLEKQPEIKTVGSDFLPRR